MTSQPPSYRGYRFPSEIISHAVWLYYRFGLSFRDVEDLLAERGITVTYEAIRLWCRTFGLNYARRLRRRRGRQGDTWYLDELFVKIQGQQQYLWRAVDEDGDVLDILVQSRRNRRAATRFFRKLLKRQGREPRRLITDKLRSYSAVVEEIRRGSGRRGEERIEDHGLAVQSKMPAFGLEFTGGQSPVHAAAGRPIPRGRARLVHQLGQQPGAFVCREDVEGRQIGDERTAGVHLLPKARGRVLDLLAEVDRLVGIPAGLQPCADVVLPVWCEKAAEARSVLVESPK